MQTATYMPHMLDQTQKMVEFNQMAMQTRGGLRIRRNPPRICLVSNQDSSSTQISRESQVHGNCEEMKDAELFLGAFENRRRKNPCSSDPRLWIDMDWSAASEPRHPRTATKPSLSWGETKKRRNGVFCERGVLDEHFVSKHHAFHECMRDAQMWIVLTDLKSLQVS